MSELKTFRPRARRLPVKIPIRMSTLPMFLDSEIMNLSKGGVFIRSDITLPLGSEVDFEFDLPGIPHSIAAVGVVVWARPGGKKAKSSFPEHPPGMGVQFKTLRTEDLNVLMEQIERLVRTPV
ncbi:MAG: TIGR02266 family protein [Pseudomonadota bacterium]